MTVSTSGESTGYGLADLDSTADRQSVLAPDAASLEIASWVRRAATGDLYAWNRLVDQYSRLIWSITMSFKLAESDAADIVQTTWMRLIEHIDRIEQPTRVGSWLASTARNECLRHVAARKRIVLVNEDGEFDIADDHSPAVDEALLATERARDVREALDCLPLQWQRLMEMLMADPPVSYAEISDQLGLPIGSIGPTRGRCLAKLRVLLEASLGINPVHPRLFWKECGTAIQLAGYLGMPRLGNGSEASVTTLTHSSQYFRTKVRNGRALGHGSQRWLRTYSCLWAA